MIEKVHKTDIDKIHIDLVENIDGRDSVNDLYEIEDITQDARDWAQKEHDMTAWEALRNNTPAVFWSIIMSSTIIMEGYDNILITSLFGYPSFQKKYGREMEDGSYQLTGSWQSALGCGSSIGIIIALCFSGIIIEKFGHRKVILVNLVFMAAFIFITVFAKNVQMLFVGQVLNGFPWGFFSIIGLVYASEVAPLPLRAFLSAFVMMCWATGQLVAAGVLKAMINVESQWSYRLPFAIQWVWIPPLFISTIFAPDSPYWLVRQGKYDKAERLVQRLSSKGINSDAERRVKLMIHTNKLEMDFSKNNEEGVEGWRSYLDCFRGANSRRTEIACVSIAGQVFGGNNFAYSPSYFFSQVGLNSTMTYNLNLGITGVAWVGTLCSWFIAGRFGRRTIYVTGLFFMTLFLFLIGIFQIPADNSSKFGWAQVAFTFCWVISFVLTLAPLAYTVTSEVSSTRLRAQTIAIGRNFYNIAQLIAQIVEPYFMNPGDLNLKGKTSFIWFSTSFCTFLWAFFRLPETKDRTYEELNVLFEKRIPARKFSSYKLDLKEEEFHGVK